MYLSICIPTYNFDRYINDCILSFFHQKITDKKINFEIVIGDSSSNNKTFKIIKRLKKKYRNLKYKRFNKKNGIDIDLEKTSKICKGKYILFFSSDDQLVDGALEKIISFTKTNDTVYLFNRVICDKKLNIKKKTYWASKKLDNKVLHFNKKNTLKEYISNSYSIGSLFSYMSCIIVKNNSYKKAPIIKKFIGTNYLHAQKLISILSKKGNSLRYFADHLVLFRGDNDSFKKNGYINRIIIDFYGYKLLYKRFFQKSFISKDFLNLMRREHKYYYLIRIGEFVETKNDWLSVEKFLKFYEYNQLQIMLIKYLGKSVILIDFLRKIKKFFNI